MMKNNMLIMKNVSKTFNPGTVNEKCALNSVDLELKNGDFATIVGSNGAGKSTLFNAITGAFFADKGLIMLDGEDITYQKEYIRSKVIGHLFQDPLKGTAPNMTIEENMALAYLRASTSKNSYFSRIKPSDKKMFREQLSLLEMGLEDRMKQPVGLLSGGQRQALTLLMATMVTPKILLLDEHTAALDPATAEKVLKLTKQIVATRNITCLMVTHNMHQALELGNRTLMMDGGRIVLDVSGSKRDNMTVDDLLNEFAKRAGKELDNDRILISKVENV
jgi:putative ABC transport system ATP-binding protein